jgi:hypothetical protein
VVARSPGGGSFRLTVAGPRRTAGAVAVPLLGRVRAVYEDGRLAWSRGHAPDARARRVGGAVRFTGMRGRQTFAW